MRISFLCLIALFSTVARSQKPIAEVSGLEWRIVPSYSIDGMYGLGHGSPFKQSQDEIEPSKLYLNENEVVLIVGIEKDQYALVRLNNKLEVKWQTPINGIPVKIALFKDKIILVTDREYKTLGNFSYDYTIATVDPAKGKILQTKKLDSKINGKPGLLNFLTSETGSYFYACVMNQENSSSVKVISITDDLKEGQSATFPLTEVLYKNRMQSDNAGNIYVSSSLDEGLIRISSYTISGEKKAVISIPFALKKKSFYSYQIHPSSQSGILYVSLEYLNEEKDRVSEYYRIDFNTNKKTSTQVILNSDYKKELKSSNKSLNKDIDEPYPKDWERLRVDRLIEAGDRIIVWKEIAEYMNNYSSIAVNSRSNTFESSNAVLTEYDLNFKKISETLIPKSFIITVPMGIGSSLKVKGRKLYIVSGHSKGHKYKNIEIIYDLDTHTVTDLYELPKPEDKKPEVPDAKATIWFADGFATVFLNLSGGVNIKKMSTTFQKFSY